jgi:hypothetical protein
MAAAPQRVVYTDAPFRFWPVRWLIALGLILVGFLGILEVLKMDKLTAACVLATGVALFV